MATSRNRKDRIRKFIVSLSYLFELGLHDIDIYYKERDHGAKNGGYTAAEIQIARDYRTISITIFPIFFKQTPAEQAQTLLHELSHSITNEQRENARALVQGILVSEDTITTANENATSFIAQLVWMLSMQPEQAAMVRTLINTYIKQCDLD